MEASVSRVPSGAHASAESTRDEVGQIQYILDSEEFLGKNPFAHPKGIFSAKDPDIELNFNSQAEALYAGLNFFKYFNLILDSFRAFVSKADYNAFNSTYLSLKSDWELAIVKLGHEGVDINRVFDTLVEGARDLVCFVTQYLDLESFDRPPHNEALAQEIRARLVAELSN